MGSPLETPESPKSLGSLWLGFSSGMLLRGMTPADVAEIVEVPSSQVFNLLGSEPSPDAQDVDAENSGVSLGRRI